MSKISEVRSEILAVADFYTIASTYTKLTKVNGQYRGLSPFKTEKTPSFFIDTKKKLWKCFATDQGGSIFDFVGLMQNLDHAEAVQYLANFYNISIEESGKKANLREILTLAQVFFSLSADKALEHLISRRGYSEEYADKAVFDYDIGFCPNSRGLLDFIQDSGFSKQDTIDSGVAAEKDGQVYAQQYGRVTLPIYDKLGSVVGFTGMAVKESPVKYLHTANTELFEKSNELFGLQVVKKAIQEKSRVGVTEGPFDAIAASYAGLPSVAILGSSISKSQLFYLAKQASDIYCVFDDDDAGKRAVLKTFKLIAPSKHDSLVYYVSDKHGEKDADDFFRKFGAEKLEEFLDSAVSDTKTVVDYLVATESIKQQKIGSVNPENKLARAVLEELRPYVTKDSGYGYRSLDLIERLSQALNLSRTELQIWVAGLERNPLEKAGNKIDAMVFPAPVYERRLLVEMLRSKLSLDKIKARGIVKGTFSSFIVTKVFLILDEDYPEEVFEHLKTELTSEEFKLVFDTYINSLTENLDVDFLCGTLLANVATIKTDLSQLNFLGRPISKQEREAVKEILDLSVFLRKELEY